MNSGQMALTIGAFMLLGTVMLNFRALNFQNEDVLDGNEYTQKAVAIGRSLFEEMAQRPFDASIAGGKWIRQASDLTSCGPGVGVYPNFDDFDDFHGSVFRSPQPGTTPTTATPRCLWETWGYRVAVSVRYVSESNPNLAVSGYTFSKRADLVITNDFSPDTVRMSYLATY
ncbi:MAG: hypothetical protein M5R41_06010 [Bacteroidia bacterium]|nr:hypothetical protein [Bacteroidia bacterium]